MSKITIANVFEISKALATKAGEELTEPLRFLSDFGEQSLRALRGGLNFRDNFDGEFKSVSLTNGIDQIVSVKKSPVDIWPTRVITTSNFITKFGWYINNDTQLVVNATFDGSPTDALEVRLAILF